jgi:cbb3-type cytochrome oxidase maturation protein
VFVDVKAGAYTLAFFVNMSKVIFYLERCHACRPCPILLLNSQQFLMSAIFLLLIASITVAAIFLGAFLWSVKKGQFDDEVSPPVRILFDDTLPPAKNKAAEL